MHKNRTFYMLFCCCCFVLLGSCVFFRGPMLRPPPLGNPLTFSLCRSGSSCSLWRPRTSQQTCPSVGRWTARSCTSTTTRRCIWQRVPELSEPIRNGAVGVKHRFFLAFFHFCEVCIFCRPFLLLCVAFPRSTFIFPLGDGDAQCARCAAQRASASPGLEAWRPPGSLPSVAYRPPRTAPPQKDVGCR